MEMHTCSLAYGKLSLPRNPSGPVPVLQIFGDDSGISHQKCLPAKAREKSVIWT